LEANKPPFFIGMQLFDNYFPGYFCHNSTAKIYKPIFHSIFSKLSNSHDSVFKQISVICMFNDTW